MGTALAVILLIVYDNTTTRLDLRADWGFSTLVEFHGKRVLFDTGANAEIFLTNLHTLGIEKSSIQKTIISHQQPDHSSALYRVLPSGLIDFLDGLGHDSRRTLSAQVGPGMYTTGETAGSPPEQALVVETEKGIVTPGGWPQPGSAPTVETRENQRHRRATRLT